MKTAPETTAAVLAFKQRILQEAPASARSVEGVDKIFYMRQPGVDATLSASGTVSYREGWGVRPRPTRYGGVLAADRALRQDGYKPYNIFTGNEWQMNEQRHIMAKKDKVRQQELFQNVDLPKINKKQQGNFYYNQPNMEYPTMEIPSERNMVPQQMKPKSNGGYIEFERTLPDPIAASAKLRASKMNGRLYSDTGMAAYAKQQYGVLQGMAGQLGIQGFGSAPKPQQKKGKKK